MPLQPSLPQIFCTRSLAKMRTLTCCQKMPCLLPTPYLHSALTCKDRIHPHPLHPTESFSATSSVSLSLPISSHCAFSFFLLLFLKSSSVYDHTWPHLVYSIFICVCICVYLCVCMHMLCMCVCVCCPWELDPFFTYTRNREETQSSLVWKFC